MCSWQLQWASPRYKMPVSLPDAMVPGKSRSYCSVLLKGRFFRTTGLPCCPKLCPSCDRGSRHILYCSDWEQLNNWASWCVSGCVDREWFARGLCAVPKFNFAWTAIRFHSHSGHMLCPSQCYVSNAHGLYVVQPHSVCGRKLCYVSNAHGLHVVQPHSVCGRKLCYVSNAHGLHVVQPHSVCGRKLCYVSNAHGLHVVQPHSVCGRKL
jgi:hypothetical protein